MMFKRVFAGAGIGATAMMTMGVAQPAAATTTSDGTMLYSVDLESGAATEIGPVGDGLGLVGLAIAPGDTLGQVYGLTDVGELVTFSADDPGAATATPITGLDQSDPLLGIDIRPVDGSIVALSDAGVVYKIDPTEGIATVVGDGINPTIESSAFGFDFNPTVDRIRVDVATGQNLRLNPDTGAVGTNPDTGARTIDGNLAFAEADVNAGTAPGVVGAAYTNSVAGATETQLYVVDSVTSSLAIQDPPNDGVLNTVGPLGVSVTEGSSFDIAPSGEALLSVPADAFGATE